MQTVRPLGLEPRTNGLKVPAKAPSDNSSPRDYGAFRAPPIFPWMLVGVEGAARRSARVTAQLVANCAGRPCHVRQREPFRLEASSLCSSPPTLAFTPSPSPRPMAPSSSAPGSTISESARISPRSTTGSLTVRRKSAEGEFKLNSPDGRKLRKR